MLSKPIATDGGAKRKKAEVQAALLAPSSDASSTFSTTAAKIGAPRKASGSKFQAPDERQNNLIKNLQQTLINKAYCDCCSKARFNARTQTCDGQNCLHAA